MMLRFFFFLGVFLSILYFIFAPFPGEKSDTPSKKAETLKTAPTFDPARHHIIHYTFKDHAGRQVSLVHGIDKGRFDATRTGYGWSKKELLHLFGERADAFNRLHQGLAKVFIKENGYGIRYTKDSAHLKEDFARIYQEVFKAYCTRHRLALRGENRIGPDYPAIQMWQSDFVGPVYQTLIFLARKRRMNERQFLVLMARFVQHLEYVTPPEEEGDRKIFGYWPPLVCLKEGAGDCDTKSTLLATLYYHFRKKACILVMTKGHAFIGLKGQHRSSPRDLVLSVGGSDYLLLETTSVWRLGKLPQRIQEDLKHGRYRTLSFH